MLVFYFKWVAVCAVLAVAVAGVAPVTARAEPACRVAPSCSDGQGRWQPRGKVDWTIDYSDALTDGTLDAKSADVHVLPLHIVERAAARQSGKPVTDLKCRHGRRLCATRTAAPGRPGTGTRRSSRRCATCCLGARWTATRPNGGSISASST